MTKELDKARRARYRINNLRAGKCYKCPRTMFMADHGLCLRHRVIYLLNKRGLLKGVLPPSKKRKREAFIAYIISRQTAIREGMLDPGGTEQRLRDMIELRLRLNITWGGVSGGDKMSTIVRTLDLHSLRERKKA